MEGCTILRWISDGVMGELWRRIVPYKYKISNGVMLKLSAVMKFFLFLSFSHNAGAAVDKSTNKLRP